MSRIAAGLCALLLAVPLLAGGVAAGLLGGGADGGKQPAPSQAAAQEIPTGYQRLYVAAASTCPGLPWTVLAAIGKVETDHGRNPDWTSRAGAQGPMQFLPATFAAYRVDGDADGTTDINNPADAVYSAAAYLCASGARNGADIPAALFSYNHDNSYVARVLTQADAYSEPTSSSSVECQLVQSTVQSGSDGFSSAALAAVVYACAQIGKPYVWGGNGDPGFDCSGLTHMAYASAGIQIPRTAQTQYDAGPLLPSGTPLQPGDLVFFGTPGNIHHVGISLGGTMMVDAPDFGRTVTERSFSSFPDYAGASRPAR